jgi:hypothetical protein
MMLSFNHRIQPKFAAVTDMTPLWQRVSKTRDTARDYNARDFNEDEKR